MLEKKLKMVSEYLMDSLLNSSKKTLEKYN